MPVIPVNITPESMQPATEHDEEVIQAEVAEVVREENDIKQELMKLEQNMDFLTDYLMRNLPPRP
jgi:hypothetical protein